MCKANKFFSCIKKVNKAMKSERRTIVIYVKSVLQTKGCT